MTRLWSPTGRHVLCTAPEPSPARKTIEHSRGFRRLVKWRTGWKAGSATSSAATAGTAPSWTARTAPPIWCGYRGIPPTTCGLDRRLRCVPRMSHAVKIGLRTTRPTADAGLIRARSTMAFIGSPRLLHIVSMPSPSSRGHDGLPAHRLKRDVRRRCRIVESNDSFPRQSRSRGARLRSVAKLLRISSTVSVIVSIFIIIMTDQAPSVIWGTVSFIGLIVFMAGFATARRLKKTAKRHLALTASQAMTQDPRPAVLYLRSFSDEPHTQRIRLGGWLGGYPDFAEEELLIPEMAKVGPFVAVGRPGDRLPQLGANRLYINDAEWTSVVLRLMDEAAGVVIRIGPGGGLAWEIRQAVLRIPPERLAFMIPRDLRAYYFFKSQADPLLPQPLPSHPYVSRWQHRPPPIQRQRQEEPSPEGFNLLGYLHFAPNWSPQFEFFKFSSLALSYSLKATHREFSRCLAPFISRLMVTAPPGGSRGNERIGVYRFNPPPNWPPPPTGWSPPPGWRPDPSWPPPPEGWNFWKDRDVDAEDRAPTSPSTPQPEQTAPTKPSGPSPHPFAAGPVGPTSAPKLGTVRSILSILWALLPTLSFGLLTPFLTPFPFAYAAARLGECRLWFFSAAYGLTSLATWILFIIAATKYWTPAAWIFYATLLTLGGLATIHAFRLRRRVFARR